MRPYEILVSIPHAGTVVPDDIRSTIPHSDKTIYEESDLYTDEIYSIQGVRLVHQEFSRVISDVNRAPDEIYLKEKQRSLGVIMLNLSNGKKTFKDDPSIECMQQWIDRFHIPYHHEMRRALHSAKFVIDGHSMWSTSPAYREDVGKERPDIVLSNRLYTTCSAQTTKFFYDYYASLGYTVRVNSPFIGRYVIGTHCSRDKIPGIQIEINRRLYMNEKTLEKDVNAIKECREEFITLVDSFCEWEEVNRKTRGQLCDLS
jgi:N-formylglutamate deformylase